MNLYADRTLGPGAALSMRMADATPPYLNETGVLRAIANAGVRRIIVEKFAGTKKMGASMTCAIQINRAKRIRRSRNKLKIRLQ